MRLPSRIGMLVLVTVGGGISAHGTTVTGLIDVFDVTTGTDLGYLATQWNTFGEYDGVTTNPADELTVSYSTGSSPFAITAVNGPNGSFPLLGEIEGFADSTPVLGSSSSNYAYLGGTTSTAAGAVPADLPNSFTDATGITEAIESAIWSISGDSLTPQWVNPDSSTPPLSIMDITGIFVVTGDPAAFTTTYGSADIVTFTLTPESATPEPASIILVGLGAIFIAINRKRFQNHIR